MLIGAKKIMSFVRHTDVELRSNCGRYGVRKVKASGLFRYDAVRRDPAPLVFLSEGLESAQAAMDACEQDSLAGGGLACAMDRLRAALGPLLGDVAAAAGRCSPDQCADAQAGLVDLGLTVASAFHWLPDDYREEAAKLLAVTVDTRSFYTRAHAVGPTDVVQLAIDPPATTVQPEPAISIADLFAGAST